MSAKHQKNDSFHRGDMTNSSHLVLFASQQLASGDDDDDEVLWTLGAK